MCLCACMCTCMQCYWRSKQVSNSPTAEVIGGCEPPGVGAGRGHGKEALLTAYPHSSCVIVTLPYVFMCFDIFTLFLSVVLCTLAHPFLLPTEFH